MCVIKQTSEVETFSKSCSIATALILVIVIAFYAGLRYHTEWDYKALFYEETVDGHQFIAFPAVTICPLANDSFLPPLTNARLYWGQFSDYNTFKNESVTQKTSVALIWRGQLVNCIQLNNEPGIFEESRGPNYGLIVRFSQDTSAIDTTWSQPGAYPMTGGVVILHPHGSIPSTDEDNIFYSPLGQTVQVSVKNYRRRNYAGEYIDHFFRPTPSIVSNHAFSNTSQVVIAYDQFGYYILQQYHVYRFWDWVGEVGGAAALLYLLQHGILWASIGCARRTCFRQDRKARKQTELEEAQNKEAAAIAAADAEAAAAEAEAAAFAAQAANPTTTTRRKRKPRQDANQGQDDTEIEMNTRRAPATRPDGRVAIDMDSLADDSD